MGVLPGMAPLGMEPRPPAWFWLSWLLPSWESSGMGPWAGAGMVVTGSRSTWCMPGSGRELSGAGAGAASGRSVSGGDDGMGAGSALRGSGIDAPCSGVWTSTPSGRLGRALSGVVSGAGEPSASGVVPGPSMGEELEGMEGSLPGAVLGGASGVLSGRAESGVVSGAGPPSTSGLVVVDGVDGVDESGDASGVDESSSRGRPMLSL
ncbi:hypothetical protein ADL29_11435 [Streptomyces chattanoogensis]|uniref:Uncharacterized protein n=2 Tax=Streptomyces chattanoogensis TaxID=66876 RepID=A0A0N0XX08_9ACTN|nr:hypothetical protein ADL29_11435 [Streptomyces chattanoogensis]